MSLDNVPENQRGAAAASVKKLVCAKIGYSNENACPMNVTLEVPKVGRGLRSDTVPEQTTAARRLQQLSSILLRVRYRLILRRAPDNGPWPVRSRLTLARTITAERRLRCLRKVIGRNNLARPERVAVLAYMSIKRSDDGAPVLALAQVYAIFDEACRVQIVFDAVQAATLPPPDTDVAGTQQEPQATLSLSQMASSLAAIQDDVAQETGATVGPVWPFFGI